MLTLNDGRSELWQWDTGRKLTVDADCSQVHFSNKVFGRSIDVDVADGTAIIPDILLQTDKDLNVWAFVGTAENGYTKISKTFKVNRRNKPADYVFTPPDQTSLEEIKEKIEYLESIQDPDAIKNAVEDYLEKNPVEAPVQSVNGQTGTVELTAEDVGAISQDDLQEATNEALAQAKASGKFDGPQGQKGDPGEKGDKGDKGDTGPSGPQGDPGKDYTLTPEDKAEIAEMAAELVEVPDSGGNAEKVDFVVQDTAPEDTSVLWVDPTDNSDDGFQEAVNTTLAQAKASGEFDGPAGQPGKDGVVAVTGATVGQTVKISAVDDDGVPTAWEPVDFPSGVGEKWEKIADIALQEEVGNVVIDKDVEGNAFLLKAFYVLVNSKVPTGTAFTYIKTAVNGFKIISNNASQNETGKIRYYYCYAKHIPDVGALCWTGCSDMQYNNNANMQQMLRGFNSIYEEGGFYSLTITPNDGEAMIGGVGTTIMVWGVRA